MYEKCEFLSMGYISALTQASVLNEARLFVCDFKLLQKTPIIYLIQQVWFGRALKAKSRGVTLAQLVKVSVGQADVQRFEPHLGHN